MFRLTKWNLANRSLIMLAAIGVLILGAFLIPTLKQELLPSIDYPAVAVISTYPGASPSIIEQNITKPIEQAVQGGQGVQKVTSTSNENASFVIVWYDFGTDVNQASQKIAQQISHVQASLPNGVIPQVQTFSTSSQPIIQLAVTSSEDQSVLAADLKNTVVPTLQGINGVARVDVTGVRDKIVTVTLDTQKLQDQGVSATAVQGALQANNATIPAGELTSNGQTVAVRTNSSLTSLQDIQNLVVGQKLSLPPECSAAGAGAGQPGAGLPQGAAGATQGGAGLPPGAGGAAQGAAGAAGYPQGPAAAAQQAAACQAQAQRVSVKLSDVATVQEVLSPSTTLTRTNGKPSIGLAIYPTADGNTVAISRSVNNQLSSLEQKLGHGASIATISDQAPPITSSIDSLAREGLMGAAFAIIVILLFLLSIRSTLVTAISIPLSVVVALIGLWVQGYSLNIFTLAGLTIAIGRVIDDSIVVLENIYRHMQEGEPKAEAIPNAVREVGAAVTASTLTTVAVFLPLGFTGGIIAVYFRPFALVVSVALLASLIVALFVIPVLASWFLKAPTARVTMQKPKKVRTPLLERIYIPVVSWVTGHRIITLTLAVLLLIGTGVLATRVGTGFIGNVSQNELLISQKLPIGTSQEGMSTSAGKVEAVLHNTTGVKHYQVTIGSNPNSFTSSGSANTANFVVITDPSADQNTIHDTLQSQLNALHDAGKLQLSSPSAGGSTSTINVDVHANDENTLKQAADQVQTAVAKVQDVTDVTSNLTAASPLVDVQVDRDKAAAHGLSGAQIGQALRQVYTGTTVTTVTFNGQQENVDLKLNAQTDSVDALKDLLLPTAVGNVKLSDVANVVQTRGPSQISHLNGARTATISLTPTTSSTGAVSANIKKALDGLHLPNGASAAISGAAQQQADAFSGLGTALLVAILLVFLVMVATFRSLLYPLILLVSIPFAAIGSILLLLVTHNPFDVPAFIGVLMLVGIVVTNAIVLLDLVLQYRERGMSPREAVIEGGRHRLRPILMTAIATICALLPLALGLSGSSTFISTTLALTVIGGLTSSTFLTLLLVPTLYVMFAGKGKPEAVVEEPPAVSEVPTGPLPTNGQRTGELVR